VAFRAHRRAEHDARLTSRLNRHRGARWQLSSNAPTSPRGTAALARQAPRTTVRPAVVAPALGDARGRLLSTWTVNDSGRLVMVWSLEPMVEAAPAIRLSTVLLNGAARRVPDCGQWSPAGGGSA
jgi:hypothetical protein